MNSVLGSIPSKQTAWTVLNRGTPRKVLYLTKDWPVSKDLKSGEVLVKVQAAALNPLGWKLMAFVPNFLYKRPHVAEFDLAGVVVDGNGTELSNGDLVYGFLGVEIQRKTRQGALSQYTSLPAAYLVKRPLNITAVEAAGVPLAALTSYQALRLGQLESDQTIFINGGSSSLGAFAIQFAKAKGAKVVATASTKNEAFVRGMGADEFIDYTKVGTLGKYLAQNPPTMKYQVIYDAVGLVDPSLYSYSEKYLARDGVFITSGAMPKRLSMTEIWQFFGTAKARAIPAWLGGVNRRYQTFFAQALRDDLLEISALIEAGSVKPVVDSIYNIEDVPEAYERILSGRAVGKVVVRMEPTAD